MNINFKEIPTFIKHIGYTIAAGMTITNKYLSRNENIYSWSAYHTKPQDISYFSSRVLRKLTK